MIDNLLIFSEPEIFDDSKHRKKHKINQSGHQANRKLISNLKNTETSIIHAKRNELSSSYSNETDDSGERVAGEHLYRSSDTEQTKHRQKTLKKSNLNSTSFSLENIFFEGLLSEGVSGPSMKESTSGQRRRILSFEDLPAIKKELSESSNDGGPENIFDQTSPSSAYLVDRYDDHTDRTITPSNGTSIYHLTDTTTTTSSNISKLCHSFTPSPHIDQMTNVHRCHIPKSTTTPSRLGGGGETIESTKAGGIMPFSINLMNRISNRHIDSLSRADILSLWRTSERELKSRLQDTIDQKRELEQKVALLQKMLRKPP